VHFIINIMKVKKRILSVLSIAILQFTLVYAQSTGTIKGTVTDNETGDVVPFATILIKGTTTAVQSDFDGKYSIEVKPGTYTLQVQFFGFETYEIKDITVQAGESIEKNAVLGADAEVLDVVVIEGIRSKDSEVALLKDQKEAAEVKDAVSIESIKKSGDGNAASAAKRVSGVSIQGGKYIYVRGLGDRYTKTLLNGLDVPGLDPDRNAIQLDIFPTNILQNITVFKSFTANEPADFGGGLVDLTTQKMPKEKYFKLSTSLGYTPSMHLNSNYLQYKGGKTDFLGFDDGTRGAVPTGDNTEELSNNNIINYNQENIDLTNDLDKQLSATRQLSFMNFGLGVSGGNKIKKDNNTFGYNASLSYKNKTTYYEGVQLNRYELNPDAATNELDLETGYDGDEGRNNVLLTALLSGSWHTNINKLDVGVLRIQNGSSKSQSFSELRSGDNDFSGNRYNIAYTERAFTNAYLIFNHRMPEKNIDLEFKLSPTFASVDDKDIRSMRTEGSRATSSTGQVTITEQISDNAGNGVRIRRDLSEYNIPVMLSGIKEFKFKDNYSKLNAGIGNTYKNRDFQVTVLEIQDAYISDISYFNNDVNQILANDMIAPSPGDSGLFYFAQSGQDRNKYQGTQNTLFCYTTADLTLSTNLKVIAGMRVEKYTQTYTGVNFSGDQINNQKVINSTNLFPSFSAVFSPTEKMNVRALYTKTISRPSFKEKSYAVIDDPITNIVYNGNIDLQESNIHNIDLRWELFPNSGELMSFSAFYKLFKNPIEQAFISFDNVQAQNVNNATLLGVEAEFKKNLGSFSESLDKFSLVMNAAVMSSRVKMSEDELSNRESNAREGETIDDTRSLQGQAPYLINTGVGYKNDSLGLSANIFYNVQGEKIAFVSNGSSPDVYEIPFHSLNFNISKKLGKKENSSVSFSVNNILNDEKELAYRSYGISDRTYSIYKPGRSFSVSYSLKF